MWLVVVVAITVLVIVLAWRGIGAAVPRNGEDQKDPQYPFGPLRPSRPARKMLAPDDDPEFLAEVDRRLHGKDRKDPE